MHIAAISLFAIFLFAAPAMAADNSVFIQQTSGNVAMISQGGYAASANAKGVESLMIDPTPASLTTHVTQTGVDNVASITQNGADNFISVLQSGNNNLANLIQSGHGNTLTVVQR